MDLATIQQEYIEAVNSGRISEILSVTEMLKKQRERERERIEISMLMPHYDCYSNPLRDIEDKIEELTKVMQKLQSEQESKPIIQQSETTEKEATQGKATDDTPKTKKTGRQSDPIMNEELNRIIGVVGSRPINIINEIVRLANDKDNKGNSFHGWEVKNYHNGKRGNTIRQGDIKGTASFNIDSETTLTTDAIRQKVKRMQS